MLGIPVYDGIVIFIVKENILTQKNILGVEGICM